MRICSPNKYVSNLNNKLEHDAFNIYDYLFPLKQDKLGRFVVLYIYIGNIDITIDDISDGLIKDRNKLIFNTVARITPIQFGPHDGGVDDPHLLYAHDFDRLNAGYFYNIENYLFDRLNPFFLSLEKRSFLHRII